MNLPYALVFGMFRIDFPQRTLSRDGREIKLGSRALEILVTLAEALGDLVSNQALVARVWPNTIVDEGSLRVHMSALRKALDEGASGSRLIINEMGRGYRLAVTVQKQFHSSESVPQGAVRPAKSNLPAQMGRIVGRDSVITGLCEALAEHRLMTIAGSGGIGKTTVALAIARSFEAATGRKAFFVDFAPLTTPSRTASAIALAMSVPVSDEDPIPSVIASIGADSVLMVLDNCEHLVDCVSVLVERLLQGASGLCILVTSREPLRADGEWVHRLASLAVPEHGESLSVEDALSFPAIALFVERAAAVDNAFELDEANVAAVYAICRQLDGIPLAIEMAAARIASMDAQTLSARLVDRFAMLTRGRRNALPRQQTLRAMLDWSYALLTPTTQRVLNRLSLFRSGFDIEAAIALASDEEINDIAVIDAAADLVAKSLLVSDTRLGTTAYRLLDTTRHYAFDKLSAENQSDGIQRRHALYVCSRFDAAASKWEGSARKESMGPQITTIDDVRYAFDWAASAEGDPAIAVQVASLTSPLWFQLSLPYEFMRMAERGIDAVARAGLTGCVDHIQLQIAYGHAIWHTQGPTEAMAAAFAHGLVHAKRLDDDEIEMRSMWGLWSQKLQSGQYPESLDITLAYQKLAENSVELATAQTAKHTLALSLERLGKLKEAHELIDEVLRIDGTNSVRTGHANAAQMDGLLAAWTLKLRLLWLQGKGPDALELAKRAVVELQTVDHDLSACFCLTMGVLPVAFWCGDLEFGSHALAILRRRTSRNGLRFWDKWADGFHAVLTHTTFDITDATVYQMEIFATLGERSSVVELTKRRRLDQPFWCQGELARCVLVENSLRESADPQVLEYELRQALESSSRQGAKAWSLRIATTLAQLLKKTGNTAAAFALLSELRETFSIDDTTTDVIDADVLLDLLRAEMPNQSGSTALTFGS